MSYIGKAQKSKGDMLSKQADMQRKNDYASANKMSKKIGKRDDNINKATMKVINKEETEQVDEGLNHDRYMRSHGKKATGEGNWMFTTKRMGEPKSHEIHSSNGKLSDAYKEASKKLGTKNLYVMEELEDEITYHNEEAMNEMDAGFKMRRYEMIKKAAKKIDRKARSAAKSDLNKADAQKGMADVKTEGKVPSNYAAMMIKKRRKAGTSEFGRHPDKKLSPAQDKHLDVHDDGKIDAKDFKKLRQMRKNKN